MSERNPSLIDLVEKLVDSDASIKLLKEHNLFIQNRLRTLIKEARIDAGISLRGMARRIGCSSPYLIDMEKGNRRLCAKWASLIVGEIEKLKEASRDE